MTFRYTKSERTEKKYTAEHAFNNALRILKRPVCTNAIAHYYPTHLFTLAEINEMVSEMIADTKHWG